MNRRELIAAVAAHSDAEPKTVDAVLRGFTDVVSATVAKGDPVVITGFAKFSKVQTKARMGRNPATGEAIKIKASKKARITPLKGFKDIVLGAAPAPKLTKPSAKPAAAKATKTTTRAAAPRTGAARSTATKATKATTTRATTAKAPASRTRTAKTTAARRAPARTR
ncbi:MAG TPA: HU family DNA-binding protein [Acidimicrobiia bacterium]|nr:HU family DNA-binding protein [Acidimicrobiia bacterium]